MSRTMCVISSEAPAPHSLTGHARSAQGQEHAAVKAATQERTTPLTPLAVGVYRYTCVRSMHDECSQALR